MRFIIYKDYTEMHGQQNITFKISSVRTCLSLFFNKIHVFIELLPAVYVLNALRTGDADLRF